MKLQVHSIHFNADQRLIDFIQNKLDKLETFYDRLVDGEVFLRLNNEGIENKTVEIKLKVPGYQLFAKERHAHLKRRRTSQQRRSGHKSKNSKRK